MKFVWVAIGLLVAGIGVGVACGPKETYCYREGKPCSVVEAEMKQLDATFDAFVFPDAGAYKCFTDANVPYDSPTPCPT